MSDKGKGPSWMDDKNDEEHSQMFQDEEGGKEGGNSYGATDDGETKSVVSHITNEEATALTTGGTLEGPQKNWILLVFHVSSLLMGP